MPVLTTKVPPLKKTFQSHSHRADSVTRPLNQFSELMWSLPRPNPPAAAPPSGPASLLLRAALHSTARSGIYRSIPAGSLPENYPEAASPPAPDATTPPTTYRTSTSVLTSTEPASTSESTSPTASTLGKLSFLLHRGPPMAAMLKLLDMQMVGDLSCFQSAHYGLATREASVGVRTELPHCVECEAGARSWKHGVPGVGRRSEHALSR